MTTQTDFRIGHRDDALALLDEMISHCEEIYDRPPSGAQALDTAPAYYLPRLEALQDAIARGIV